METYNKSNGKEDSIFESHITKDWRNIDIIDAERIYEDLSIEIDKNGIESIDEGFLGKVLGGVGGFIAGPAIGKVIASALGIKKGLMYDMLTSRLVGTALGTALAKYFKSK